MEKVTYRKLLAEWENKLSELYPPSEIRSIFRIVLEDILEIPYATHNHVFGDSVEPGHAERLTDILHELQLGKPVQHIVGFCYFADLKIQVSPQVLIPRPETEELVYLIAEENAGAGSILDLCTGSGCIALALKKLIPAATILGTDISEEAIQTARTNAAQNALEVTFAHSDALKFDPPHQSWDVIVSNPPYIPHSEAHQIHVNVKAHEPSIALFVEDADPLIFYRSITAGAAKGLRPQGKLYFELHENFAVETADMVRETGAFDSVELLKDLQGKMRMLRAIKH